MAGLSLRMLMSVIIFRIVADLQQLLQDGKSIVEVCREDVGLAI
jgi:hypothetical protein